MSIKGLYKSKNFVFMQLFFGIVLQDPDAHTKSGKFSIKQKRILPLLFVSVFVFIYNSLCVQLNEFILVFITTIYIYLGQTKILNYFSGSGVSISTFIADILIKQKLNGNKSMK